MNVTGSPTDANSTVNIEATKDELRVIMVCLNEILTGPNAVKDGDWDALIGWPKELVRSVRQSLYDHLTTH